MTDYYADLGVPRDASVKDIKTAYRKLAMQCHPDRNESPESLEKFKLITTAYEVLGNETKKAEYDLQSNKFHHTDFNFNQNKKTWSNFKFTDFTEPTKPSKYRVTLTLEEAYTGNVVTVNGRLLRIPAGIKSHTTLYSDKSIIEVIVTPHNKFKRSENDLLVDTDLAIQDAILGVCVIITHIDETKLQFNVPAGTQTGQVIRLSGKGMYDIDNDCRGDLLIRCNVVIPTKLTEEQINFFKSMQTCNFINI